MVAEVDTTLLPGDHHYRLAVTEAIEVERAILVREARDSGKCTRLVAARSSARWCRSLGRGRALGLQHQPGKPPASRMMRGSEPASLGIVSSSMDEKNGGDGSGGAISAGTHETCPT